MVDAATAGIVSRVSRVALILYMPLYVAVDAVLGIGSSILIQYREGLAPADRAGADGALEALFFEPSAIDWLDQAPASPGKSRAWRSPRTLARLRLARFGAAGRGRMGPEQESFPTVRIVAGFALGIAVWQYLILERRRRHGALMHIR